MASYCVIIAALRKIAQPRNGRSLLLLLFVLDKAIRAWNTSDTIVLAIYKLVMLSDAGKNARAFSRQFFCFFLFFVMNTENFMLNTDKTNRFENHYILLKSFRSWHVPSAVARKLFWLGTTKLCRVNTVLCDTKSWTISKKGAMPALHSLGCWRRNWKQNDLENVGKNRTGLLHIYFCHRTYPSYHSLRKIIKRIIRFFWVGLFAVSN